MMDDMNDVQCTPLLRIPTRMFLIRVVLGQFVLSAVLGLVLSSDGDGWATSSPIKVLLAVLLTGLLVFTLIAVVKFVLSSGCLIRVRGDTIEIVERFRWIPVGKSGSVKLLVDTSDTAVPKWELLGEAGTCMVGSLDIHEISTPDLEEHIEIEYK